MSLWDTLCILLVCQVEEIHAARLLPARAPADWRAAGYDDGVLALQAPRLGPVHQDEGRLDQEAVEAVCAEALAKRGPRLLQVVSQQALRADVPSRVEGEETHPGRHLREIQQGAGRRGHFY